MVTRSLVLATVLVGIAAPSFAAADANAGRDLVTRSCITCHSTGTSKTASDGAPPLSFLAKDNKERPAWVRGWLMDPHPPMPNITLSRAQIDNVIAYLNSLPAD
jgi:mono/diheme cytochrome c family protein